MSDNNSQSACEYVTVAFLARRLQHFKNTMCHPVCLGDLVVVSVDRGKDLGRVAAKYVERDDVQGEISGDLLRAANENDLRAWRANRDFEKDIMSYCSGRIKARNLEMKLAGCESQLDRKKIRVFFTAERRTDFRKLVRDLAARFKARIEMRQIGVRDHAKRVSGIGICGRELCCSSFKTDFSSITLRSAREKRLTPNPSKVSGLCSRLMCCLDYELDFYKKVAKMFPEPGERVRLNGRRATVKSMNIFQDSVRVRFEDGSDESMSIDNYHRRRRGKSSGKEGD
jgi:cell fate regulator YaaT (PSP1 superfamily)